MMAAHIQFRFYYGPKTWKYETVKKTSAAWRKGLKADTQNRYPRWTPRQRELDKVNMRKNEEMFAEVFGALPETKRQKEVEAEWSTAGGKVKIIAQVLGFLVPVNVVGNFLINTPNVNRFVRSSGDRNNY